ncbi:unnamed protein product, partial [Ectocarpus sp. 4 AP-2014]
LSCLLAVSHNPTPLAVELNNPDFDVQRNPRRVVSHFQRNKGAAILPASMCSHEQVRSTTRDEIRTKHAAKIRTSTNLFAEQATKKAAEATHKNSGGKQQSAQDSRL